MAEDAGDGKPSGGRRSILALVALLAAGIALTVRVFYPGVITYDAAYVHIDAINGRYGDWQSPAMAALWRLIDPLAPGTTSMFVLIVGLYWAAFAILAFALLRRRPWITLLVPILAVSPPAFVLAGVLWRDVLLAVAWLLAAALVFAAAERRPLVRVPVQAIALALLALGALVRPNAFPAAPILATFLIWPSGFSLKRMLIAFVPIAAALFVVIQIVYYGVLGAQRQHVEHSLYVFDLGGITHFTGRNAFPVTWTNEQQRLLVTTCYDPHMWDVYWNRDPCKFVMERLEQQDHVFGTATLTRAWAGAILAAPLAYVRHRSTVMWTMLFGDNLVGWFVDLDQPTRPLRGDDAVFTRFAAVHDLLTATPIFDLGLWLVACIGLVAIGWRRRAGRDGAFVIASAGSGAFYVASYWPVAVATDYRYGYWAVLAALAAAAVAAAGTDEPSLSPGRSVPSPR